MKTPPIDPPEEFEDADLAEQIAFDLDEQGEELNFDTVANWLQENYGNADSYKVLRICKYLGTEDFEEPFQEPDEDAEKWW